MVLLRRALVKSHTLDTAALRSLSVLMQVETLGEALAAGWRVHALCLDGAVEYTRSRRSATIKPN
jgi:hypothetical protein